MGCAPNVVVPVQVVLEPQVCPDLSRGEKNATGESMIPSIGSINAVVSHHETRGSSPKCSPFRHLPNNLIIDIIKTEMDRQKAEKDTRDYWIEMEKRARVINPKNRMPQYHEPYYYRKVMRDVVALGRVNKIVQKGGHYKPAPYDPESWDGPQPPILIPQKNLPKARWNKRSDSNYIMALIRHYSTRGSTARNLALADETAFGRAWMRVRLGWGCDIDEENVMVSIRAIRWNRERNFKEKLGYTTMKGIWRYHHVNNHNYDYVRGMDEWRRSVIEAGEMDKVEEWIDMRIDIKSNLVWSCS